MEMILENPEEKEQKDKKKATMRKYTQNRI